MSQESANQLEAEKEAYQARLKEWSFIEELVMLYQSQFEKNASYEATLKAQEAINELIIKFNPLFKKYIILLKTGQINFKDQEMKQFVYSFLDDNKLKAELKKHKQKSEVKKEIYDRFNFIKETYGFLDEEEILIDLQVIFMTVARRYQQMGRSFCGYLYNCFRYEVYRHIKKFLKNPINIPYRHTQFEDYMKFIEEPSFEENYEDHFYEDNLGIPDLNWIQGETCSDNFKGLSVQERKIVVKYYLEDWNDRQISEEFGIHINTVNQKRRCATMKIAKELGLEVSEIKRNRKSGKKATILVANK
ncbi:RNA polymerase sigma factor [Lysinibacillus fusiformis]|uniref:RNA polymerase sigma factor n=1 Tax=Lysinibacillus fusiformis TaxID=28031 RepID=UPI00046907B6|nr:sigma-70 family RNA polymerase sigma factor [Lysinibacillus fusiformis]